MPQTDRATRCVSRNLVSNCQLLHNCRDKLYNKYRTNRSNDVTIDRHVGLGLCASSNDALTVVGVIHKLDRRQVLLTCCGEIF